MTDREAEVGGSESWQCFIFIVISIVGVDLVVFEAPPRNDEVTLVVVDEDVDGIAERTERRDVHFVLSAVGEVDGGVEKEGGRGVCISWGEDPARGDVASDDVGGVSGGDEGRGGVSRDKTLDIVDIRVWSF